MPFKPGQSGNPGGVSKAKRDVIEAARGHGVACIEALASIAMDINAAPAARVSAISVLLDRGFGKAAQPVTGEGGEGPVLMAWQDPECLPES